jgi:hypothetical protein
VTGQAIALGGALLFFLLTRSTLADRLATVIVLSHLIRERDWDTPLCALRTGLLWKDGE